VVVLGAAVLRQLHSQHMQLAIKSRSRGFFASEEAFGLETRPEEMVFLCEANSGW
jgi:hypothetical protein